MIIGVDFDNTIVCYDEVFHRAALEKGLIPADLPATKDGVRNHLRAAGKEHLWTELQGEVYGTRMDDAMVFLGVREFFAACRLYGVPVKIISHKTRFPYAGPRYDLHGVAREWLKGQDGLNVDEVYFELTKEAKLERIGMAGCTHFIDDLPEFLAEPGFPAGVERILFDRPWEEIHRQLFPFEPLPGGANNRVYRVEVGSRQVLRKEYFQHPQDPRDRLCAEFGFCRFAWDCGVRVVPEPVACDTATQVGLYEFIEGRTLRPQELAADHVREALDFFRALNAEKHRGEAQALPAASEACFSIAEHLDCVGRRVAAAASVLPELQTAWERVREHVARATVTDQIERCLSPSDFGFHNSLITPSGRLRFIDFEYAGWDDPAKVVCDFFCQLAVPVPMTHWEEVVQAIASDQRERVALLLPVYRLKWCCILLNEFLPMSHARRRFAGVGERREAQLTKARSLLHGLC